MPITLLGTSHISPKSAKLVREKILSGEFDIVAIELDRQRLQQLFSNQEQRASLFSLIKHVGVGGAIFAKLGHFVQKWLGGRIGMTPGAEMKAAVLATAQSKTKLALIDRPIHQTLRRFSKAFTFKQQLRLFFYAFRFTKVKIDLASVPDDQMIVQMLEELRKTSPVLYEVLVEERNVYMSKALTKLQEQHPDAKILAVVGAGHIPGMTECLKMPKPANSL